ncbi:MAG: hypothetical protein ACI8ZB_005505 [Desulforhopalus sp.]|jgi:hypothetical protein
MNNEELKCSQCGFTSKEGQYFCGDCGQKLKNVCTGCDSVNPPTYKFCGQCGKDLRLLGTLILDRTGLIIKVDKTANSILQIAGDDLLGKPFLIFVNITDRAFFFSCWNMTLSSSKEQDLEVELKPEQDRTINTHLTLKPLATYGRTVDTIHVEIEDITDSRRTLQQFEEKEKILEIIGSITEIFHPAKRKTRQKTINGVLEKIGVVSLVQYAFVSRIDPVSNLMFTEFKWQVTDTSKISKSIITLPLDTIHPVLLKLQKGITYIAEDFSSLNLAERHLWKKWHPGFSSPGSIACELIYRDHRPVGIIGLIRTEKGTWPRNTIMLMKLSAQLISETLPKSLSGNSILRVSDVSAPKDSLKDTPLHSEEIIDLEEVEVILDEHEVVEATRLIDGRMLIESNKEGDPDSAQRVFATSDGAYALQCPKCERTELVAADHFKTSGWILKVTCPCSCSFRIIREMRKVYRKEVQLSGSFARDSDDLNRLEVPGKLFSMEVTNISKRGLNFKTVMTRSLQVGDNIQLRFNLDNSSKSPIKKSAMIKSVNKMNVGCQFQYIDKHDTTLGFYFL